MNVYRENKLWGRQGFTMVELLVVIALISIIVAIGVPQFQRYAALDRIRRPSNDLIENMRLLRAMAIKENRAYTLVIYPDENVYMYGFDANGDGDLLDATDTFGLCNDTDGDRLPNTNNVVVVQGLNTRECVKVIDLQTVYGTTVEFGTQANVAPDELTALTSGDCNGRTACFPDTGTGTVLVFNTNGSVNNTGSVYFQHSELGYSYCVRVGSLSGAINLFAWNGEEGDDAGDPPIQPAAAPNWREVR